MALFPFAQFELAGRLGIEDGRYLIRSDSGNADDVLVVSALHAPRRARRRRGRRAPDAEPSTAAETPPATRATIIRATAFESETDAGTWLERIRDDADDRDRFLAEARVLLNRALHVHAVTSMDPYVTQIGPAAASVVRIGFGDGDELAAGRWREALVAPTGDGGSRRQRRIAALHPQERLAAVLGGRERLAACETLILRAGHDLDHGRAREAALQLRGGVDAMLGEIGPGSADPLRAGPDQGGDLAALADRRAAIEALASKAAGMTLNEEEVDQLAQALAICERILRRRRILGERG